VAFVPSDSFEQPDRIRIPARTISADKKRAFFNLTSCGFGFTLFLLSSQLIATGVPIMHEY